MQHGWKGRGIVVGPLWVLSSVDQIKVPAPSKTGPQEAKGRAG